MDTGWRTGPRAPEVFVNPRILWASEARAEGPEGCLSLPGPAVTVARAVAVRLGWTGLDGTAHERDFDGFAAICIQHECDHLDGILTFDRLAPAARTAAIAAAVP
jgi:peptide deformylase